MQPLPPEPDPSLAPGRLVSLFLSLIWGNVRMYPLLSPSKAHLAEFFGNGIMLE